MGTRLAAEIPPLLLLLLLRGIESVFHRHLPFTPAIAGISSASRFVLIRAIIIAGSVYGSDFPRLVRESRVIHF